MTFTPTPTLLLFDIDGTLLRRAADAHRDSLLAALTTVYGLNAERRPQATRVQAAGRTDTEIARMILLDLGVDPAHIDAGLDDLRAATISEYARRCPPSLADKLVPGIPALLDSLDERSDTILSLVTGNLEPVARLKLSRAGIGHHFAAGQGAFGSDSEDRTDLPVIARGRAGTAAAPHPRSHTVVIGDTPRDIACARADRLDVIAVATGPYSAEELEAAGADTVARDAGELANALERRIGVSRSPQPRP